jgi:hypothetical protein
MRVEVEILIDGLHGWESVNSVPTNATVELRVEWSRDGVSGWNTFPDWGNMVLTRNSMRQMRFVAAINLPSSVYSEDGQPVYIRVTRLTKLHVGGFRSRTILTAIRTRQYSPRESSSSRLVAARNLVPALADKFCRVGVRIKANQNTQDALDRFSVVASMIGRIWNGSGWSIGKRATSNPASVALEILTGLLHEPSRFRDAEIDPISLGRLYSWCENRQVMISGRGMRGFRLEACGILTSAVRKLDVLQAVLATADAGMYVGEYGRLRFWFDDFQTVPIGLLNPQRLVSMNETRSLQRRTDGYAVKFIDRYGDWSERTERLLRPRIAKVQGKNTFDPVNFEYVTDYYHAMWLSRRMMAREILQPGEIEVEVGREGRYYAPGSLIKVQHEGFRIGIGSGEIVERIVEGGMTVGVRTMERFEMRDDRDYWVDFHVVDGERNHVVTRQIRNIDRHLDDGGRTDRLIFTSPIMHEHDKPETGNIISVIDGPSGGFARVWESKRCVVMDSSPTSTGYRLKIARYDDYIYRTTLIEDIPPYQSSIQPLPPKHYQTPPREPWIPPPNMDVGWNNNWWLNGQDTGHSAFSPRYRGVTRVADLQNTGYVNGERMNPGDWVMYMGQNVGIWTNAHVMRWTGAVWELIPLSADTSGMYMVAMSDIVRGAGDSIASRAFIGDLMATRAFIDNLLVRIVQVRGGGAVQSENFIAGSRGFRIQANGMAEFYNATIRGHIEATSGTFRNVHITDGATFEGNVFAGPLIASNERTPPSPPRTWNAGTTLGVLISHFFGTLPANATRTAHVTGGLFAGRSGVVALTFGAEWYAGGSYGWDAGWQRTLMIHFSDGSSTNGLWQSGAGRGNLRAALAVNGSVSGYTLRFIDLPDGGAGLPSGSVYRIRDPNRAGRYLLGIV